MPHHPSLLKLAPPCLPLRPLVSRTRQAILTSPAPGPTDPHPLPHDLVDAMAGTRSFSTASNSGGASTAGFMPNVLLVLQSPAHAAAAVAEGSGAEWLTLSLMDALDACDSVPPAVVSCVPPPSPASSSSFARSSSSSPESPFDAVLLDTPLAELWRQEARKHFE